MNFVFILFILSFSIGLKLCDTNHTSGRWISKNSTLKHQKPKIYIGVQKYTTLKKSSITTTRPKQTKILHSKHGTASKSHSKKNSKSTTPKVVQQFVKLHFAHEIDKNNGSTEIKNISSTIYKSTKSSEKHVTRKRRSTSHALKSTQTTQITQTTTTKISTTPLRLITWEAKKKVKKINEHVKVPSAKVRGKILVSRRGNDLFGPREFANRRIVFKLPPNLKHRKTTLGDYGATADPNYPDSTDPNYPDSTDPNTTTDPNSDTTTDANADTTTDPNADTTTDPNADTTTDPNADTTIDPNSDTADPNIETTDPNTDTTDPIIDTTDSNADTIDPNATNDPNATT